MTATTKEVGENHYMTKKCNAIYRGVPMGDGIKIFYEKPDIIIYEGTSMSLTEAYLRASMTLLLVALRDWYDEKLELFLASLEQPQTVAIDGSEAWPKHSLLCECEDCQAGHYHYTKAIRSK